MNANARAARSNFCIDTHVSVGGVRLAATTAGAGPDAVVLVHGHPFNRTMWAPQVDALAGAGWRVLAPDLRGYGDSDVLPGTTPLARFADDLAAVLDHHGVARAVMAGLSMGGQIVMEFAHRHPSRVRAIVLAATSARAETAVGRQRRYEMAARLEREGMDGYAREVLEQMIAPRSAERLPAVAAHVLRMMRTTEPAGAAAALRGRAERIDYSPVLARLAVPALVVVGDQDAFTTRADADNLHARLRHSTLVWMEGVGHMPNLERAEEFNRRFLDFLHTVPPDA